jgi:hypothetical protein
VDRREDRREGYPLEHELTGRIETVGGPLSTAVPKRFILPFDRGVVSYPRARGEGREPVDIAAKRLENFTGAPYVPTGNPLVVELDPNLRPTAARYLDAGRATALASAGGALASCGVVAGPRSAMKTRSIATPIAAC